MPLWKRKVAHPKPCKAHLNGLMPRAKKDPILAQLMVPKPLREWLADWNDRLAAQWGFPEEPRPAKEVGESSFVNEQGKTVPLEILADKRGVVARLSYFEYAPSPAWSRSLEFLRVILTILIQEKRGITYTRRMRAANPDLPPDTREMRDALSGELPPDTPLPRFPDALGTPEKFLERWRCGEIDIKLVWNRHEQEIVIREHPIPIPPDDEDAEDSGEPGTWEGLRFVFDRPEVGGS